MVSALSREKVPQESRELFYHNVYTTRLGHRRRAVTVSAVSRQLSHPRPFDLCLFLAHNASGIRVVVHPGLLCISFRALP